MLANKPSLNVYTIIIFANFDQCNAQQETTTEEQRNAPGRLGVPDRVVLEGQVVEVPIHVVHHPILIKERRRAALATLPLAPAAATYTRHAGAPLAPAAELQPCGGSGGSTGEERGSRGYGRAGVAWAGRRRGWVEQAERTHFLACARSTARPPLPRAASVRRLPMLRLWPVFALISWKFFVPYIILQLKDFGNSQRFRPNRK